MTTVSQLTAKVERKLKACMPKAVNMPSRPTKATIARFQRAVKKQDEKCRRAFSVAMAEYVKLENQANVYAAALESAQSKATAASERLDKVREINKRRIEAAVIAASERSKRKKAEEARIAAGGKKRGRKPRMSEASVDRAWETMLESTPKKKKRAKKA